MKLTVIIKQNKKNSKKTTMSIVDFGQVNVRWGNIYEDKLISSNINFLSGLLIHYFTLLHANDVMEIPTAKWLPYVGLVFEKNYVFKVR